MNSKHTITEKYLLSHLETLKEFQSHLFQQGHTFWHCDSQDEEHKKPFYYYQINRSKHMSTCSTCYKLMENRKKIREVEKLLNVPLTPFITNHTDQNHVKRMNVSGGSRGGFNVNHSYAN